MSASTVILAPLNNSNIYTYNGTVYSLKGWLYSYGLFKEFKVYIGVAYRVQCCGA